MSHPAAHSLTLRCRLACAVCALVTTGATAAVLLGLFHQRAPTPWLAQTPALASALDACRQQSQRTAQRRCVERVVAAARRGGDERLAAIGQQP